jgi:predicted RNase H-like HicB family nuclease
LINLEIEILNKVEKETIISEEGELKLKEKIQINISFDKKDESWIFNYPELKIVSYGKTYDEAMKDFDDYFFELYEHYSKGDKGKMKGNALTLVDYFSKMIA